MIDFNANGANHLKNILLMSVCSTVFLTACSTTPSQDTQNSPLNMTNPASSYCVKIGGTPFNKKDQNGNAIGYCTLPDGQVVDEWKLFKSANQTDQQRILISYSPNNKQTVLKAIESKKLTVVYDLENVNIVVIAVPSDVVEQNIQALQQVEGVLSVEQDSTVSINH